MAYYIKRWASPSRWFLKNVSVLHSKPLLYSTESVIKWVHRRRGSLKLRGEESDPSKASFQRGDWKYIYIKNCISHFSFFPLILSYISLNYINQLKLLVLATSRVLSTPIHTPFHKTVLKNFFWNILFAEFVFFSFH